MAPSTTQPASTKVFATYDLLEDIFLHLPLCDLLLSRRVCKQWGGLQDTSVRVRKALFLEPYHQEQVYYPDSSEPHWYLVPNRTERALEGILDEPVFDPKIHDLKFHGVPNSKVSYTVKPTPDEAKVPDSGGSDGGSSSSGDSDVTICNLAMDKHHLRRLKPTKVPAKKFAFRLNAPKDYKMHVSQVVSGPFLNPFAEIFLKRFWQGARATYQPQPDSFYANPNFIPDSMREQMLVRPVRYTDGTIHNRSHRTHAVQRFNASWRKMAPFSAATASIRVECFDFGFLQIWEEGGMTAGSMMEQLGEHWGGECPDCCIFDFWFAEFVLPCCYTDQSYMNRGEHGVRKLGLDNTGWDALSAMHELDSVRPTGERERHMPVGMK